MISPRKLIHSKQKQNNVVQESMQVKQQVFRNTNLLLSKEEDINIDEVDE